MAYSLGELRIENVDMNELAGVLERLLRENGLEGQDATAYVQVTRGAAPRTHAFPDPAVPPTVYAYASPLGTSGTHRQEGISAVLLPDLRWSRCDIKSVALLPNVLANQAARERGAQEAILLRGNVVTEGSRTNVCAVFNGRLWTCPCNGLILDGITRRAVLELCPPLGIDVVESPVTVDRLADADEIMVLSTTLNVMPVVRLDDRSVGTGTPGPTARALQRAFLDLIRRGGTTE
jgi:D-alanine transaminase